MSITLIKADRDDIQTGWRMQVGCRQTGRTEHINDSMDIVFYEKD